MTTLFSQTVCTYSIELFAHYSSSSQLQDTIMQYTGGRNLSLAEQKRNCADTFCRTLQNKNKSNHEDQEFKDFVQQTIHSTLTRLNTVCSSHQAGTGSLEPLLEHFNQLVAHTYDVFYQHQLLNLNQNLGYEDAAIILKKNLAAYLIKNKTLNGLGAHKAEYGWLKGFIRYSGRNIKLANKKEVLIENFLASVNTRLHGHQAQSGSYNMTVLTIIEEIRKNNNIIREENSLKGHLPLALGSFIFTVHIPTEFKQGQGTLEDFLTDAENKIATLTIKKNQQPSSAASLYKPPSQQSTTQLKAASPSAFTAKKQTPPQSPTFKSAALTTLSPPPTAQPPLPPMAIETRVPTTTAQLARHHEQMPNYQFSLKEPSEDSPKDRDFEQLSAIFGLTSPK